MEEIDRKENCNKERTEDQVWKLDEEIEDQYNKVAENFNKIKKTKQLYEN